MSSDFYSVPAAEKSVIENHSRSFSLAAKLLPRPMQRDVQRLYAWCRWCDDAVDEASTQEEAQRQIDLLRKDVGLIFRNEVPQHPASLWLAEVVRKYEIPRQWPMDLLDGMEADVTSTEILSIDELKNYCYQAAGTVGLMMARILGVDDSLALRQAKSLGMAMQLTNIARDVDEDWKLGRRYIPAQWLPLVPCRDRRPNNDEVRKGVDEILRLADAFYEDGYKGLEHLPNGARVAIRLAGRVYQEIGNEIRRQDFAVIENRVFVPRSGKFRILLRCFGEELVFRFRQLKPSPLPVKSKIVTTPGANKLQAAYEENCYLGFRGLSITCLMAMLLFLMVGLNPKESAYSHLPWLYSSTCSFLSVAFGFLANRSYKKFVQQ